MVDHARARKLADRIAQIVAEMLEWRIKDPRLGFVTVTEARLTGDLREATVFYTVYGSPEERTATAAALASATGVIRSEVGHQTGLKHTPSLTFVADTLPEGARHMEDLVAQAREADARLAAAREGAVPAGDPDPYREPPGARRPRRRGRPRRGQPRRGGPPATSDDLRRRPRRSGRRSRPRRGILTTVTAAPSQADLATQRATALALLDKADEVCLACHVRPDADALGSMLAVAHALRAPGRRPQRVVASFGDEPFEVPEILRFLPGLSLLSPPDAYPHRPEVMVTFDAGSIDRLGLLAGHASRADQLIVIDHHASNTRFGTVNLIDPGAAATAMLVLDLIDAAGLELTRDIGFGLYSGLVADTGSFKFPATTPEVHQAAARLLSTGIEPGMVARELWDRAPFGYLGLLSAVLGRAVLEPDAAGGHGLVWTTVTRADRAAHGLSLDAVESVIDVVRRTDEAEVAIVLKQSDDGLWQASARSKGKVDVGRACSQLGGGGHRNAAGVTLDGSAGDAIARLRGRLAESS